MADYKKVSEDVIRQVITVEEKEALQKYHKVQKGIKDMRDEVAELKRDQEALRNQGKKGSEQWKDNAREIASLNQRIKESSHDLNVLRDKMSINVMTIAQLKKLSRDLTRELEHMSAAADPEEYSKLSQKLVDVKNRMKDLSIQTNYLKDCQVEAQRKSFVLGTAIVEMAKIGTRAVGFLIDKMREVVSTSLELAESADGVQHSFAQLDNGDELLAGLRKATKGTVNDFELMKATMKAKDFKIPLEDLGKLLSFAQLKAQQTGQSVDYMVDSIVTGLGRQSKMILDNLGISAAEIDEKIQETGDFAKAVASIVNTQLAEAGDTYVSAADRALQKTTDLQNAELELGKALLPFKEWADDAYGATIIRLTDLIKWTIQHIGVLSKAATVMTAFTIASIANRKAILSNTISIKASRVALKEWIVTQKELQLLWSPFSAMINGTSLLFYRWTGNVTKARVALVAFTKAIRAVPYLAVAAAIVAVVYALYKFATAAKEVDPYMEAVDASMKRMAEESEHLKQRMVKDMEDIKTSAKKSYTEQKTKLDILTRTINDNTKSVKKRREALDEIKKIVPAYHAQLTNEGKLINNNTAALKEYTKNLYKVALAQAALGKINVYADKMLDRQQYISERENNQKWVKNRAKKLNFDIEYGTISKSEVGGVYYKHGPDGSKKISKDEYTQLEKLIKLRDYNNQSIKEHTSVMDGYNKSINNIVRNAEKMGVDLAATTKDSPVNGSKPTKTGGSNTKDNSKAIDDFKRARQKELDIQKRIYEEQLVAHKKMLAEKKMTREEYDSWVLASESAYKENVLKIEEKYQKESQNLSLKDTEKKKEILSDQQRNVEKATSDSNQAQLRLYEQYQQQMNQLRSAAMSEADREKADRDAQLAVLDAYYKASLRYAEENKENTLAVDSAYFAARDKLEEDWRKKDEERKFRARSSAGLTTIQEEKNRALSDIDQNTELSPEEKDQAKVQLERELQERIFQVRQEYGLVKQQELYDQELEQLRLAKEQGYLTEEEYEKAKTQMKMDQYKEQFDYYKGLFSNAVNALQDAELANVEAKYDAEIDAAKKAGKDTSKLEEKAAEEKLKIQKKYADVQFAIRASEIIADTAQAIIATHKSLGGWTPWAIAAAALMGVTGAAQLAVAAAERNKVKSMTLKGSSGSSSTTGTRVATGKEEGGFLDVEREQDGKRFHAKYDPNRRGYVDRPTVIVGEGPAGQSKEWIASNAAVENPTIRPILDILDRHQRAGSVRTLDLNKYLLQQRGYAQGGSIANTPLTSPAGTGISPELMERFVGVMERMERDGIPAILGLDEIDAKNKLRDKSKDIGSK